MNIATRLPATRRPAARRRHRSTKAAVARWAGRWAFRGAHAAATWTGHHARGYATHVAEGTKWRAERYARHGNKPVVTDLTTGRSYSRHDPNLHTLLGADHSDAPMVDHAPTRVTANPNPNSVHYWRLVEPLRLSWWDRLRMRIDHENPNTHIDIHDAVRFNSLFPPSRPGDQLLTDLDNPSTTTGEEMAKPVRDFNDLHDPDIDPLEFPEELPAHLDDVARLVHNEAGDQEDMASEMRVKAASMREYADYMEKAECDPDMCSSLREAAEAMENAAQQLMESANNVSAAGDLTDAAQRRAESEYGDFNMPRFDKV